jgi:citrate synthase
MFYLSRLRIKQLMNKTAELILDGKTCKLPIIEGSENERAVDISSLRNETGCITLDDGYANTGSCLSKITFIDGEQGILRYRGIPIEELAEGSTFIEVAHLIIMGHLPSHAELRRFSDLLTDNELLNEAMKHHFEGFPASAHPMAILSSMINAASCFYPNCSPPTPTTILRWRSRDSFRRFARSRHSHTESLAGCRLSIPSPS